MCLPCLGGTGVPCPPLCVSSEMCKWYFMVSINLYTPCLRVDNIMFTIYFTFICVYITKIVCFGGHIQNKIWDKHTSAFFVLTQYFYLPINKIVIMV